MTDSPDVAQEEMTESSIVVPIDPDAGLQATRIALESLGNDPSVQAMGLVFDAPNPGTNDFAMEVAPGLGAMPVEGSMHLRESQGNFEIVVVHLVAYDQLVAVLLGLIQAIAHTAPRGTEMHEELVRAARGRPHDDGLPEAKQLGDKPSDTMGGKPTSCPECGAKEPPHKSSCPLG